MAAAWEASAGTLQSESTTLDIGLAGRDRLVLVMASDESTGDDLTGATVDGKACTLVTRADNPDGDGNHTEMWSINEAALGVSNGSVTCAITGGDSGWATHALIAIDANQGGVHDTAVDEVTTSSDQNVGAVDVPAGGIAVLVGSGGGTTSDTFDAWTSPMIEGIEADPTSAIMGHGYAEESSLQTGKTYQFTLTNDHNRISAVLASWGPVAVGGTNPHGPLGHPLHGPLGGPV